MIGLWLAGSLLATLFIASQIDLAQVGDAFQQAEYGWVALGLVGVFAGLFVRGIRWRVLLNNGLPLGRAFNIVNIAYLVNGVLPFRIGEVARAYLATRANPPVPLFKSFSTIILERLLDVLAVLVISGLALAGGPLPDELRGAALFFAPATLIGFVILVALASQQTRTLQFVEQLAARVSLLERINLPALVGHFLDGLAPLTKPVLLLNALLWTAISWFFSLLSGYLLMYAFYGQGDWAATCLFTAVASFAVAVPAVPGNLGTYELSILLAMGAMGYGEPASRAVAFALVVHASNLVMNALLGAIGFIREGVTLEQLSTGVRGLQTTLENKVS
jgi:glycosyltransferase 2 family protein